MLELCLFLLLLNFDAFLTGLAFGFAGVRITNAACLLVSGLGALFLGLSMSAGGWLSALLHTELLSRLALVFLLLFTLYLIVKYCGKEGRGQLGGLWRRPARLDNNADKQISPGEAAWPWACCCRGRGFLRGFPPFFASVCWPDLTGWLIILYTICKNENFGIVFKRKI